MILREFQHYSGEIVKKVRSTEEQPVPELSFKPAGFWVSDGDSWKQWCEGEQFRLETLVYKHRVVLDMTNICDIKTIPELDEFHANYSHGRYIDWTAVAEDFQGIVISPYYYERRFTYTWHYSWDCASGCIWDAAAVKEIALDD